MITNKTRRAWLYDAGLLEALCFELADKNIQWYVARKLLGQRRSMFQYDRFAYSFFGGYQPGFKRCKNPT